MARILQIRRGTTAQNDNFTGMTGEISFDTDTKTLRVHDGETLGGFTLARADQIPDSAPGGEFDINDVSDEFWAGKFAQFAGNAKLTPHISTEMTIYNKPYIEYVFNEISVPAQIIRAELVCQTAAAGYAPDDICTAFGIDTYGSPVFNSYVDNIGLHIRIAVGSQQFWVAHKTTGVQTNIVNNNWKLRFRVYC